MRSEAFLQLIKNLKHLSTQEKKSLELLVIEYPYFQLAYALLAKVAYDHSPEKAQTAIQYAAIYATDRKKLKVLLEQEFNFNNLKISLPIVHDQQLRTPSFSSSIFKPSYIINSYIDHIGSQAEQKITKKKSLEQLNIIENFIQKSDQFSAMRIQTTLLNANQIDLSQENTTLEDDLLTESLAEVMMKQGRFQRALEIYTKLQLKYPQKKAYFSLLIEKLKEEIT